METKAKSEPQVQEWLVQMEKELCRAAELFDAVNARLLVALRPEPPVCTDELKKDSEQTLVPLATQIRESVYRLQDISRNYEQMLSRIEL